MLTKNHRIMADLIPQLINLQVTKLPSLDLDNEYLVTVMPFLGDR